MNANRPNGVTMAQPREPQRRRGRILAPHKEEATCPRKLSSNAVDRRPPLRS